MCVCVGEQHETQQQSRGPPRDASQGRGEGVPPGGDDERPDASARIRRSQLPRQSDHTYTQAQAHATHTSVNSHIVAQLDHYSELTN